MMFTWIADLLVVSGLLGISAFLLERILRPRHRPTRPDAAQLRLHARGRGSGLSDRLDLRPKGDDRQ